MINNKRSDKKVETQVIIKRSPPHLFYKVEQWLTEMSMQGWHLIARDYQLNSYTFEKGEPQYKEYFMWDLVTIRGNKKYDVFYTFPLLEYTFGISPQKSKLNQYNKEKNCHIIEVDLDKINSDPKHRTAYQELKQYRNRMYAKRALNNWIGFTILISVFVLLSILLATGVIPSTFRPSWA